MSLIITAFLIGTVTSLIFAYAAMLVSRTIHAQVFERMTRAPVRFFDSTPRGRIVNRFAGDMGIIDENVSNQLYFLLTVRRLKLLVVACEIV